MKKAWVKIGLVLLPVILVYMLFPVDKRSRYLGLKDDCFNHGIWIYDRIHLNNKPVDVAFIGSSHTVNGINDRLIEDSLKSKDLSIVNLGYCRLGRNLSYAIIKELLKTKHPKMVVIEVMEDEDRYSHPVFPYIAETKDVFAPTLLFNRDIEADMQEAILYKLTMIQQEFFSPVAKVPVSLENFGFACSPDTASAASLLEVEKRQSFKKAELSTTERNFHMKYPRYYIREIGELCKNEKIKLCFLYLPGYGSHSPLPRENETYLKYGEVLCPPSSITKPKCNWKDEEHLNQTGAAALSKWVSGELAIKL